MHAYLRVVPCWCRQHVVFACWLGEHPRPRWALLCHSIVASDPMTSRAAHVHTLLLVISSYTSLRSPFLTFSLTPPHSRRPPMSSTQRYAPQPFRPHRKHPLVSPQVEEAMPASVCLLRTTLFRHSRRTSNVTVEPNRYVRYRSFAFALPIICIFSRSPTLGVSKR